MHFGGAMFFTDYSMSAIGACPRAGGARFRVGLGARALAYPAVQLTVHDVDSGEDHFQTPGLAGRHLRHLHLQPDHRGVELHARPEPGRSADRRPGGPRQADRDLVRRHRDARHRRHHHRHQRRRHDHRLGERGHRGHRGRRRRQRHARRPERLGPADGARRRQRRGPFPDARPRWPAPTAPSPSTPPPGRGATRSTRAWPIR